jgi:hypothetical protein
MNALEKSIRILPYYWFVFVTKTARRHLVLKVLSCVVLAFFIVLTLDYFSSGQEFTVWKIRWLIWAALFFSSIWFVYDERINAVLFYAMVASLIIINYILWIIPMMLLVYLIYLALESRRMSRLKKMASTTPEQLSGIKTEPRIVIKIRKED